MSRSNRTLGRILLVVLGLVLLLGGLGVVAVQTLPAAASAWHDVARPAIGVFGGATDRATSVVAWTIVLAAAVVIGVLAIVVLATRGGGRAATVIESEGGPDGPLGSVRIDAAAVEHALSSAIGELPQIASLAIDVYRVRGGRAVRIKVRPRRGAAPREITDRVDGIVRDLDGLLGQRLPVLLQIARGGHGSVQSDRVR